MQHGSYRSAFGRIGLISLLSAPMTLVLASSVAQASVKNHGLPKRFSDPARLLAPQPNAPLLDAMEPQPAQARSVGSSIFAAQGQPNDRFGASLDRSGNTLVVGAWGSFDGEGMAYVSTLGDSGWSSPVELEAPSEGGDNLGWSVATDGSSIALGARWASEPDSLPEPLLETGAVTFFEQGEQGWEPTQRLYSSGRDESAGFGFSMDMQAGVTLVGEPFADDVVRGRNETGAAYIFTRNSQGRWSEAQRLVASDAASEDLFGLRVALSQSGSRTHAFLAALGRDDKGAASGAVYVFERSQPGASFVFKKKLLASDGVAQDQFGFSISARGDRLVVGAPGADLPNAPDAGAVYVFERVSGSWTQQAKVIAGEDRAQDRFGYQVGLSESGFAASRFPNPAIVGTSRAVSVYERISSSEYQLQAIFNPPQVQGNASFGGALNYEQGVLLVGMEAAVNPAGAASGVVEVFEPSSVPAPLGGILGLGGLGLGLIALGRRRA